MPPIFVRAIPLWGYGVFEVGYQTVMFLLGVPGVAWFAHLFGLATGVALGFIARQVWGTAPLLRT